MSDVPGPSRSVSQRVTVACRGACAARAQPLIREPAHPGPNFFNRMDFVVTFAHRSARVSESRWCRVACTGRAQRPRTPGRISSTVWTLLSLSPAGQRVTVVPSCLHSSSTACEGAAQHRVGDHASGQAHRRQRCFLQRGLPPDRSTLVQAFASSSFRCSTSIARLSAPSRSDQRSHHTLRYVRWTPQRSAKATTGAPSRLARRGIDGSQPMRVSRPPSAPGPG